MNDYRGDSDAPQVPDEVEISQTFPYGFLHPSDYPEGGEVARFPRIGKIAGDTELEGPLPVCGRIPVLEPRCGELLAPLLDLRALLSAPEFSLELAPIFTRQRRGIDQCETGRGRK